MKRKVSVKRLLGMSRRGWFAIVAALALIALVAGCGSSSSSSSSTTAESSEEAPAEETETASNDEGAEGEEGAEAGGSELPEYSGPEKGLPTEYEATTKKASSCTIGYQNIYGAISSLAAQQESAEEKASELGCKLVTLDDQLNPTTQVNNFNQLLAQKVDAIVVYPIVPSALAPSLKQAESAGIPVISDTTPPSLEEKLPAGYISRVTQGWDQVAYLRAKHVAEENPGAEFAILGLAAPVSSLEYLGERTKYWAEKFGLKFAGQIDAQEDNPASASTAMSGIVGKYPNVGAVFAYNDNAAVAASTVARASQSEAEICGGNGQKEAFQAIESGSMSCTVLIEFGTIGEQLVQGAYNAIAEPETKLPETIVPPVHLVDSETVGELTPIG
jgi:ABC-type sugar transport system substrate-binding protein